MRIFVTISDKTLEQTAKNVDLILNSNTTNTLNIICLDEDGVVVDITGAEVIFVVKEKVSDTDTSSAIYLEVAELTNPTSGEFDIEIEPDDCDEVVGNFVYGVQITLSDDKVYKLMEGTVCFRYNIVGIE